MEEPWMFINRPYFTENVRIRRQRLEAALPQGKIESTKTQRVCRK